MLSDYQIDNNIKRVILERMRLRVQRRFSNLFTLNAADLDIVVDAITNEFVYTLSVFIASEPIEHYTIKRPIDWKEALKEHIYKYWHSHWPWGIEYAARRWPVKYAVTEIDVRALYPKMSIPDGKLHIEVYTYEG